MPVAKLVTAIFPMWSWIPSLSSIPSLSTDDVVHAPPPVEEIHLFQWTPDDVGVSNWISIRYPRGFFLRFDSLPLFRKVLKKKTKRRAIFDSSVFLNQDTFHRETQDAARNLLWVDNEREFDNSFVVWKTIQHI
jgi:hypothetical protein